MSAHCKNDGEPDWATVLAEIVMADYMQGDLERRSYTSIRDTIAARLRGSKLAMREMSNVGAQTSPDLEH